MARVLTNLSWLLMVLLATLVAVMASRFFWLPPESAAPPPLLPMVLERHILFLFHAGGGLIALFVGPWNFLERSRKRFLNLHRWLGRIYLVSVLASGISGFMLALTAQGGLTARIGFGMLAILWLTTAAMAYHRICPINFPWKRNLQRIENPEGDPLSSIQNPKSKIQNGRDIDSHRRWMIRNYSLTFAAVTLRLWLPALSVAGYSFNDSYMAVAWLSWVPNLIVAEIIANKAPSVVRRQFAVESRQ